MHILTKDRYFYTTVLRLALPIAFQNLVTFLVTFSDNVMVGALGDNAISGVYLGGQLQFLLQQFVVGMGSALLIITAQYWGKKQLAPIRRLIGLTVRLGLLVAAALSLLSFFFPFLLLGFFSQDAGALQEGAAYLRILSLSFVFFTLSQLLVYAMRSIETAKIGAYISVVTLLVNVALNWVLIFGRLGLPAMGVRGAATATLTARILEAVLMSVYVLKKDQKLRMKLSDFFSSSKGMLRSFLRYGLPVIAGDLVWAVNILCQGAILGHYTADVIAAASMTATLNNLVYVWLNGLWGGVSILIGKTIGEGRIAKVKEYARTCQILFAGIGILSGGALFFLQTPFIGLYSGISAGARAAAYQMMGVLSVTIVGTCYEACCLGALVKAGGDTAFVFKNDTLFVFLIVLPSALLARYFGAPLFVVYLCLKSDQLLKCIVAAVKVNRYRWIKTLTQ